MNIKKLGLILAVLLFLLSVGLPLARVAELSPQGVNLNASWAMVDFRAAVYYPVVAFLAGENPYNHVRFLEKYDSEDAFPVYPPMTLLLHLPFGLMPIRTAYVIYFLLTLALGFVVAWQARRISGLRSTATGVLVVASLALLSRPGHMNLLVGQVTLQVVVGVYLALGYRGKLTWVNAVGLTLSMIKPTFGVPLAFLMLVSDRWKAVARAAVLCLVLNVPILAILISRAGGVRAFVNVVSSNLRAWQTDSLVNPETSLLLVNVPGLVGRWFGQAKPWDSLIMVASMAIAASSLVVLRRSGVAENSVLVTTIICVAVLVGFHHQPYDLLVLTLPVVALAGGRLPSWFYEPSRYWAQLGLYTVLALNYASTHSGIRILDPGPLAWKLLTSINAVAVLSLFLIYTIGAFRVAGNSTLSQAHSTSG